MTATVPASLAELHVTPEPELPQERALRAEGGATAVARGDELLIRAADGRDLVAYDATRGVLRILVEGARVELVAPQASVAIDAQHIDLRARQALRVDAPELVLAAAKARVEVDDGTLIGGALRTAARELTTNAERWERSAGRVLERATSVLQEATLIESRVDRARFLAASTLDLLAGRVTVASEEDTIVDGKRVLLG